MGQKKKLAISLLVTLGLIGLIILIVSFPTVALIIGAIGAFLFVWYAVYVILFQIITLD